MRAIVRAKLGRAAEGEAALKEWVIKNNDFNSYFFLSRYHRATEQIDKGFLTLADGAALPMGDVWGGYDEAGENHGYTSTQLAAYGAPEAYLAGRYDVALKVCRAWMQWEQNVNFDKHNYNIHALMAACDLAQRRFDSAEKHIRIALTPSPLHNNRSDSIDALGVAIRGENFSFCYVPRGWKPFEVLSNYQ